jgi:alkanesulfonate monooxygenase SsuD/methylene tetrahydromethanopterin reductase-like flavin-dependent oxidoreductase (luciferase family)
VLCTGWRNNSLLLAKQLAAIDQISGGRLTAGLGLGGWTDDYVLSGVPLAGRGKVFDETLATLRQVWSGQLKGEQSAVPPEPDGGPSVLVGGMSPASFARAARAADGWVAPGFGMAALLTGISAVRAEWALLGRPGRPRILVERYFCLGPEAVTAIDTYLARYWENSPEYAGLMRADLLSDDTHVRSEVIALAEAGCDDLVMLPCSSSPDQPRLMADALARAGAGPDAGFEIVAGT